MFRILFFLILVSIVKLTTKFAYSTEQNGGMPQLDPSSFNSQVFWLIIIFSLLFLLINFKFLPKITDIRRTREDLIKYNIDTANENNKKIVKINEEITQIIERAKDESDGMIKECQQENSKIFNIELQKAVELLKKQEKSILSDLKKKETNIKKDIFKYSKSLAESIYKRILNKDEEINISDFKKIEVKSDRKSFS